MKKQIFLLFLIISGGMYSFAQDDRVPKEDIVISATPVLMAREMESALAFYTEKLGFRVISQVPPDGIPMRVMLGSGQAAIVLQQEEILKSEIEPLRDREPGGGFLLHMKVNNIEEIFHRVAHGCEYWTELRETEHGTVEFTVKDPLGCIITFSQDR